MYLLILFCVFFPAVVLRRAFALRVQNKRVFEVFAVLLLDVMLTSFDCLRLVSLSILLSIGSSQHTANRYSLLYSALMPSFVLFTVDRALVRSTLSDKYSRLMLQIYFAFASSSPHLAS